MLITKHEFRKEIRAWCNFLMHRVYDESAHMQEQWESDDPIGLQAIDFMIKELERYSKHIEGEMS